MAWRWDILLQECIRECDPKVGGKVMLKGTKAISLNYSSVVRVNEQDVDVVYMNAQIRTDGSSTATKTIQKQEIYEAHKEECQIGRAHV